MLWVPFARAIASLVCSFVSFLCCSSCSRLGDNRADEGDICRVENGPISQLSSSFYCLAFGLLWLYLLYGKLVVLRISSGGLQVPMDNMPFNRTH